MDQYKLNRIKSKLYWEQKYNDWNNNKNTSKSFLPIIDYLDPDFDMALKLHVELGSYVLDVGTGTGEQAISIAEKGYKVIGVDISKKAIELAINRTSIENLDLQLKVDDIFFSKLEETFDCIVDRGCFTLIKDKNTYLKFILERLNPRGFFMLKTDLKSGIEVVNHSFSSNFKKILEFESEYQENSQRSARKAIFTCWRLNNST